MEYKLLVCDFDGTLYTDDFRIPEENVNAIDQFRSQGGQVLIATGRLFSAIRKHLPTLHIEDGEIICHQGASTFDVKTGSLLNTIYLESDIAISVLKYLESLVNVLPLIFYQDKAYTYLHHDSVEYFANLMSISVVYTNNKLSDFVENGQIEFPKILIMVDESIIETLTSDLNARFVGHMLFNRASANLIEGVSVKASKGNAVADFAKRHNIPREQIVAIGDAENDISMIKYAGLGIAVGNAMPKLKDVADVVVETNNDLGVAKAVKRYLLNEKHI